MTHKRLLWSIFILGICTGLLLAGCQFSSGTTETQTGSGGAESTATGVSPTIAPDKTGLVILHTNDVLGYIDTCG
ncbi:MAG: hypothetical protein LLG44_10035 [Chloroflexi bacterium]|nr:hypothetical protein [Chloroflexota bacterium]